MDLGVSTENFFNQFESLSSLAQEVPLDTKAIDRQRVGSLLLSAVPLEGLGLQALASSSVGQAGIAAIKTIGSKIASVVEEGVENLGEEISNRFAGAGTLGQDAIQSIDTSDLFATRSTAPPAAAEVEEQVELGNMADVPAAPATQATTETLQTTTQAAEEVAAPVADITETAAATAGETAGEIAAVTASTVLEAIPVVGAIAGLITTLALGFRDLTDKPHESAPIYAASQLGL